MARQFRVSPNRITIEQTEEFDVIIVISGSRIYNDYDGFAVMTRDYLDLEMFDGKTICFVTGEAQDGPDDMIITLCDELEIPFYGMPADWNQYGKRAGFMRNIDMAAISTHLLAFWADKSKGTGHMIDVCTKLELNVTPIIVDSDATRKRLNS